MTRTGLVTLLPGAVLFHGHHSSLLLPIHSVILVRASGPRPSVPNTTTCRDSAGLMDYPLRSVSTRFSVSDKAIPDDDPVNTNFRNGTLKCESIRAQTPSSLEDARPIVATFVTQYNEVRPHSAIQYLTPKDNLEGRPEQILAARCAKLAAAQHEREAAWRGKEVLD